MAFTFHSNAAAVQLFGFAMSAQAGGAFGGTQVTQSWDKPENPNYDPNPRRPAASNAKESWPPPPPHNVPCVLRTLAGDARHACTHAARASPDRGAPSHSTPGGIDAVVPLRSRCHHCRFSMLSLYPFGLLSRPPGSQAGGPSRAPLAQVSERPDLVANAENHTARVCMLPCTCCGECTCGHSRRTCVHCWCRLACSPALRARRVARARCLRVCVGCACTQ